MPKPRRISNILKLANKNSTNAAPISSDPISTPLAPSNVTSSTPRAATIDDLLSQLPNQGSSQPSQQGAGRSHHRANVSSQLPNRTLSQPSQQGAGSSHLQTNVSSQLPNQTSSQPAQQGSESSQFNDNISSPLPSQTTSQPVQQEVERRQRRGGRTSTHYWFVDALDEEHGTVQKLCLTCKDVNDMPNALRVIVEFDEVHSPIGEAAGLLSGVCGLVATNSLFFPIGFEKWSSMPEGYFNEQWKTLFQVHFCFKIHEDLAKRYVDASIGKKWREYRLKLWNSKYDPLLSKSQIIQNKPADVNLDHWALYVDYRFKPETIDLCKKNQQIRNKQVFSHTCGAKSLARRRHELTIETGKTIGRGQMWNMTHKKKDGSYVNEKAKEMGEKIDSYLNQNLEASSEISSNDAVGKVFGKEHPGRVRAMGMGVVPTTAFKQTTTRLRGMEFGSSSGNNSNASSSLVEKRLASVTALLEAVVGYISTKEGGTLPADLAAVLANHTQQDLEVESDPSSSHAIRRSSDASNTHDANHQSTSNDT